MSSHPFLRTPTGGTIRYPHRAVWQLTSLASRVFLCLLVLFILSALLAALYDVSQQLINSNRSSKIADVAITFGTYFVIAVVGIAIIVSRTMTDRGAVASIPKAYVPVKKQDVPKPAHELISNEYDRARVIAHISQPKGRTQEGLGRPGTNHENVRFRSAILSTIPVLRSVLAPFLPPSPLSPRAAPLSPLAPLLSLTPSPLPEALAPLAELYEHLLVRAKYGKEEPSEEDWDNVVKIVAVFVGVLGAGGGGARA